MTISLAVIGAGRIGQIHATNAARNRRDTGGRRRRDR